MTDAISKFARISQLDAAARESAKVDSDKAAAKDAAMRRAAAAERSGGDDQVKLSDAVQQAMKEPAFDKAKVDAIRQALKDGQYPLDSHRIAKSFVDLEKMIKG